MDKPEQMELFDGKLLSKEAAIHHVIIGQLFDTYWLVQYADKLYIIDQHAAHEKVLYERLMKDLRNRSRSLVIGLMRSVRFHLICQELQNRIF